ncbi:DUF2207 domain-containing protein [Methanosphaera sp. WGK6]|uniref:DUF2207 domain-containing protein n=1 Tax=Methanosphaera sp. WGK6 TaxID=1561964 RepID=UPI00084BD477|nr:DUF2207 domain-containing protein [Methanosphaera sp. WGK6]OED30780.1 hypothetical protein NL43_00205 [Methanosphaera sp. WGK6]
MNRKNSRMVITGLLVIVLLFTSLSVVFSEEDNDRDYNIPFVEKILSINSDGSVDIKEDYNYTFYGTFNGVTRDIPLSGEQSIENISVETPGLYNTVEVKNYSNTVHIIVHLFSDAEKTKSVTNQSANIIYNYTFNKGVKIYDDVAEFQYMSWGPQWEKEVIRMTTYVKLPGNKTNVEVWNNPPYLVSSTSWITYNTLETRYKTIDAYKSEEQRLLIPKEQFNSTENADVIKGNAKEVIENDQRNYQNTINFNYNITYSILIVSILMLILPFGIYYKYGREPKLQYSCDYETDLPTKDSPVFINAVVNGNVEDIDLDAFYATILDLIDRSYMKVFMSTSDDTVLEINDVDTSDLQVFEEDILTYFNQFTDKNNRVAFSTIKNEEDPLEFQEFLDKWNKKATSSLDHEKINRFFHNIGSKLFKIYSRITLIYAIIVLIYLLSLTPEVPTIDWAFRATEILIPLAIITALLPNTVAGQWTLEGKEFHDRWKHFERYVNNYSLIKEYPPASIQVWGRYLVYATALGDAQAVTKNMKEYFKQENIPQETINQSDITRFTYYGMHLVMFSTFHEFKTYQPPTNNTSFNSGGSFGNIGGPGSGGFGGGGGGAF